MTSKRQYIRELFFQNPENIFSPNQIKSAVEQAGFPRPTNCQMNNDLEAILADGSIERLTRGQYRAKETL